MSFYNTQEVSIKNIMDAHTKNNEKDSSMITRKHASKPVKPSRPMFMSYYSKL